MATFNNPRKTAATVTASATLARGFHTPVDATSGAITVTLPTGTPAGVEISVEKVDTSANAVIISGTMRGAGGSTVSLTYQFEGRTFLSEGNGSWRPTSDHRTSSTLTTIVTGALAADTTAANAAAAAVNTKVAGLDVLVGSDLRVAQPTDDPDISYAVTDASGSASWLAVDSVGGLPPHAVAAINSATGAAQLVDDIKPAADGDSFVIVDANDNRSDFALDTNGKFSKTTIAAIAAAIGGVTPPPTMLVTAGDSITAGHQGGDLSYGEVVAPIIGLGLYNPSVAGETSTDIATRFGALTPTVTLTGNLIPATTTAVTLTAISPVSGWRTITGGGGGNIGVFVGTLVGIPGTLRRSDQDGTTWTFTRTTAGTAQEVPPGSKFYATGPDTHRNDLWIIEASYNGGNRDTDITAMVNYLRGNPKKYIVMGLTTAGTETTGTSAYNSNVSYNLTLRDRYGDWSTGGNYFDMRGYLINSGLAAVGLTATTQDLTDIANDTVPTSLRADNVHPNRFGYRAIGMKLADIIASKGWANR